ncbi:hypothetical protein NPA08_04410 [Mycoplasmopsis citelli]|uniref:Uncharacterized protein n=2 Tax=Mycoplasmopsis citelli TaxID=171281 RepID=A0A449B2F3_9BACT|nr:hypothetical protein [Mycoplasmopsis citelli]UUD36163.1 hypothetical protein NPA08_04410 [Mycoplasmopsis citelli]VEU74787.1 Uncharacterised protein [Mycoplasmopsis citelli]
MYLWLFELFIPIFIISLITKFIFEIFFPHKRNLNYLVNVGSVNLTFIPIFFYLFSVRKISTEMFAVLIVLSNIVLIFDLLILVKLIRNIYFNHILSKILDSEQKNKDIAYLIYRYKSQGATINKKNAEKLKDVDPNLLMVRFNVKN